MRCLGAAVHAASATRNTAHGFASAELRPLSRILPRGQAVTLVVTAAVLALMLAVAAIVPRLLVERANPGRDSFAAARGRLRRRLADADRGGRAGKALAYRLWPG